MDLSGASLNNGTKIQIYTSHGTGAQEWKLSKVKNLRDALNALASQNKDVLADGTYYISSSLNNSYVLDVSGGSINNHANVQLYQNHGTSAQGWKVVHDLKGYVTFINVGSGKALDVSSGISSNNRNIQQYSINNSYGQKWIIVKDTSGYKIVSALDEKFVLDLSGGRVGNHSNIQLYTSHGTGAQRWCFTKFESLREKLDNMAKENNSQIEVGTYVISNFGNPAFVIDVSGGQKTNNRNVQIYQSNNTNAQKWYLKKDSAGYITFINVNSDKALDVSGGVAANNRNVQQYQSNGSYAQKWIAKKNSDGSITFVSALDSNFVLDISSGVVQNNKNIQLYQSNGTIAQKFKLTRV